MRMSRSMESFGILIMKICGSPVEIEIHINKNILIWHCDISWAWALYGPIYINMPIYIYISQIKICAEYRDMLPRPRLVCQEPGLRPIGRSPGVPDKSSRGLGSMSRYSAQILICFIAYIFLFFFFFYSTVGLVGNFAGLPVCTVPSAIVHCNHNEAGH